MGRILTLVLSLYWATTFAVSAVSWSAAERLMTGTGAPLDWATAGQLAIGTACALTAALFAWLFFSALLDSAVVEGQTDEVAYVAFAAAAVVLTATLLPGSVMHGRMEPGAFSSMAALLVSYLAIHVERRAWGRPSEVQLTEIRAAARLMALSAAHDTLVSRLAPPLPANDE